MGSWQQQQNKPKYEDSSHPKLCTGQNTSASRNKGNKEQTTTLCLCFLCLAEGNINSA